MGVKVRQKDNCWYVFINHKGERAAQKMRDVQHALDTAKAVSTAISAGQFAIAAVQKKPQMPKEETKPKASTLAEFFDKIMSPFWEGSLSPGTFSRYEVSFRLHIRPVLGAIPINELTRDQVKDFVVSLLQKNVTRRTESGDERRLSKDSIRNVVATLRAMLNEAVDRRVIAANPATRLGKLYKEAASVRDEVDPFTREEIPVLLDATRTHYGYEHFVMLLCLFHTGLRAAELAGLQWPDVDFRGRFISVRRQYKDKIIKRTKTKKIRKVDLSDSLVEELQTLQKRRQEDYLKRGKNEIPDWVFLSPGQIIWQDGKPIGREEGQPVDMKNFYNRVFLKACIKAKVRRRRLHDTRHSFATILIMNGESLAYVRDQLGHSSIKLTVDTYSHWIPGSNRQAVNKLPSLQQVLHTSVAQSAAH